jgi:hypothetical protein
MRLLRALAVLLLVIGCSKESPPPPALPHVPTAQTPADEALARARVVDASRDRMQAVPGTFTAGEASARYVAYWDTGVLRLIDERSDFGEHGTSAARYYLDTNAKLFLYEARDERTVTDASRAGGKEHVEMRLVFDPELRMLASEKKVAGRVQPVQATEIDGVRAHFEALRSAASAR